MNTEEDNQRSSMIMSMERTLNKTWFQSRLKADKLCKLSTSQYWDWLIYVDVSVRLGLAWF